MNDDLLSRLQIYYTDVLSEKPEVQVGDLVSLNDGWESDVYAFNLTSESNGRRQSQALVLRIYHGEAGYDKSALEFEGMRQLRLAGYPVPQVLHLERENSPFDRPFMIMDRIEGQVLWSRWFSAPEAQQQAFLAQFSQLLVQLHTLDWRPFMRTDQHFDPADAFACVDRTLAEARTVIPQFQLTGLIPILDWLAARRDQVPCRQPAVVHLDYHPGNILLRDDGSAVVIDWTQLAISDARFDLAWSMLLVGTQEDAIWRDRILQAYESLSGTPVEEIEYFEVYACAKRLFSVVVSLTAGAEQLGMRTGAEGMIRARLGAIKQVYKLLGERTGIEVPEVETLLTGQS